MKIFGRKKLRIIWAFALSFLILLFSLPSLSVAAESEGRILFSEPTEVEANIAEVIGAAIRHRIVQVNVEEFFEQPQLPGSNSQQQGTSVADPAIAVNLFDSAVASVKKNKLYQNSSGSFTWVGEVGSHPDSTAIFIINKERAVYGVIDIPKLGNFSVRPMSDGNHVIEQINPGYFLSGEDDSRIPPVAKATVQAREVFARTVESSSDDGSIIDVYVTYDQDANGGSVAAADAQALAELFIAYTNQAYENSDINQRVWLVGSVDGYDHTDTNTGSLGADLDAVTNGAMAGLHAKRDEYHADLVVFLTPYAGASCGGLAWLQTSNNDVGWNVNGFSAMNACSFGQAIFAHELGHNMGSRHDWYVDQEVTPATIGHGYVDTNNGFRTIMSYGNRCNSLGVSCPTIPHFSNPAISFNGAGTGVAGGTSSVCAQGEANPVTECDADNKINFDTKAVITSQFRDSRVTWTGAVNANWTTAGNWEINEGAFGSTITVNRVPRSYDNVYIPAGLSTYPTISTGTVTARELVIASGATLNMTGGTLTVGWSWEDAGGFNATGGNIIFSGPIGLAITSSSAFQNVQIGISSDSSEVILESNFDVDGDLEISTGSILKAGSHTINIAGNWQENNPAGFRYGTGTVIFDGVAQSVNKITSTTILNEDFSEGDGKGCGCNTIYLPSGWVREGAWYGGELSNDGDAIASGNGWLHSAALSLSKGVAYTLTFDFEQYGGSDTLRVYLGNTASSSGMSNLLGVTVSTGSNSFSFSVPDSGTYYLGFHHDGSDWSYMDNVLLNGASGISFYNLQIASGITTFNGNVLIANDLQIDNGAEANFSTYTVTVVGTTTDNNSVNGKFNIIPVVIDLLID